IADPRRTRRRGADLRATLRRRSFARRSFARRSFAQWRPQESRPSPALNRIGPKLDRDPGPDPRPAAHARPACRLIRYEHAAERRAIVQASPELQERGRTKFAAVTSALAAALEQRGAEAATAALLAPVGTAIFRAAFDRWAERPERASLADRIRE